jgi:hypothetical protein
MLSVLHVQEAELADELTLESLPNHRSILLMPFYQDELYLKMNHFPKEKIGTLNTSETTGRAFILLT